MAKAEEKKIITPNVASAYVSPSEKVLDPEKITGSLLERMPQPTGWRMLVLPYAGKRVTKGGIELAKSTVDREALATVVAYVVKMGPLCYNNKDRYGEQPWCQERQWGVMNAMQK